MRAAALAQALSVLQSACDMKSVCFISSPSTPRPIAVIPTPGLCLQLVPFSVVFFFLSVLYTTTRGIFNTPMCGHVTFIFKTLPTFYKKVLARGRNLKLRVGTPGHYPRSCSLWPYSVFLGTPLPHLYNEESEVGGFSALQPPKGWDGDFESSSGPSSLCDKLGKLIGNNPEASNQHLNEVPISLLTP